MPYQTINGAKYYYEEHGYGNETIVFSHGLLWSGEMFVHQVKALKERYRVITYDHRGQGRTEVTANSYDMDTLTEDARELIVTLEANPCHFVGLSMGGFVGQRLAIRHPELLKSLVLIETSADTEPPDNIPRYKLLGWIARYVSLKLVSGRVMPIMFGKTFMRDPSRSFERREWQKRMESNDKVGIYRALQGVIERDSVYEQLGAISLPTLVIIGEEDVAIVPEKAKRIHEAIPTSELVMIPAAGHTSSIEQPQKVTEAIQDFLNRV